MRSSLQHFHSHLDCLYYLHTIGQVTFIVQYAQNYLFAFQAIVLHMQALYNRLGLSLYLQDHMFVHIMPVSYGLTLTFRLGSVLATLSVTLERFFAIVLPLKDVRRFKKWLIPGSIIITGNVL